MALIHLMQRLAALTWARDAASVVVLVAALVTAILVSVRAPAVFRRHRFALASLGLGALLLLVVPRGFVPPSVSVVAALVVAVGFVLHTLVDRHDDDDLPTEEPMTSRQAATWCAAAASLAAVVLLTDLGGYAGSLMVWEPEAMSGLIEASKDGTGFLTFVARGLLWDDGVLSASHHSLLYGSGTYALWLLFGASTATLRLMSVLLAVACLPTAYVLATRIGGRRVATAAVTVLSLNPVLLFYGRYGISIAGSLFSILLLLVVCERLADPDEDRWWLGPTVAAAAFLATLGYSPARVVASVLVAITLFYIVRPWGRRSRGRRLAAVLMVVVLALAWLVQVSSGTARTFVAARGEQLFTLHAKPEMMQEFIGEVADPEHLTLRQRVRLTGAVLARTVPDLGTALSFCVKPMESAWHVIRRDAPDLPLIQGPLLLFAVWGFVQSATSWRRRWPILLLGALAAASLPILLTTRADIHRLSLAMLPVALWAATGIGAAHRLALACGVPRTTRAAAAVLLVTLIAASNSTFLFFPDEPQRSILAVGVGAQIGTLEEPLVVGLDCDPRTEGEIQIALCNWQWRDHVRRWELLSGETVEQLTDRQPVPLSAIALIEGMRHRATVILAPREPFEAAARVLTERGAWVRSFGSAKTGWWRIDLVPDPRFGAAAHREPDAAPAARRTPLADGSSGSRVPLGYGTLRDVRYGFKAPRFDAAYDGTPLAIGGVTFDVGIGMHAWTSMRFEVPGDAAALEAVIGMSDVVATCDNALVTFEVWNDRGSRIFDSGPVRGGTPPRRIRVPLRDTRTVDLVLTEGGNGRDCDHGNWAEPVFIFER